MDFSLDRDLDRERLLFYYKLIIKLKSEIVGYTVNTYRNQADESRAHIQ